jgi:sugar phosphate isomerase/epimerase
MLGLQILFDFHDIVDAIGFARYHRFTALELNLGNLAFSRQLATARGRARVRAAARTAGVRLALHAVDGPSFFIPSDRVRRCAVRELECQLDYAADIGALNVVMHLGFDMNFGMDGKNRYTHAEFPDYYREEIGAALARLKEHARGRARLCVENVGGFRYPLLPPILDRLLGGSLGLCLDVGHTNVIPPAARRAELAFYRRHRAHIHHAHIHDNSGLRDEHCVLGRGRIDFVPFFRLLARTDALLVFEVRPKEGALACREYFDKEIAPKL